MELKLKTARYDHYEPLTAVPMTCETMREHIVPDSCTDIARIVETTGQVFVTGRELSSDGRLCASGTVDVSVLYIPEKGNGPCVLHFQLPFQCCGDRQWNDAEYLDICGELQSVDTRLLNPRKVLTRVNLILYPTMCRKVSRSVCTDALNDDDLELLRCQKQTRVIAGVQEKEFTFLEELPVSQGRGGVEEVISCRADVRGTDCKLIGTKLVLKGIVAVTVLYRESGGTLEQLRTELPFSQIVDGAGMQEEWDFDSGYQLLSLDCRIGCENGADDRHVLTLNLLLRGRVTAWRTEEICFIADLYSTRASIVCHTDELSLRENCQRSVKRLNIRETLETGTPVKSILDMEVGCGSVRVDSAAQALEIPLWARCVYLDENDALHSVRRDFVTGCPTEQDADMQIEGWASCRGDIMASILPDGIELRFPVDCSIDAGRVHNYICVSGGEFDEEQAIPPSSSLVLRKIGREESLWSVAKAYRTTCKSILEVNEIPDEHQLPHDKLLLIPRCR